MGLATYSILSIVLGLLAACLLYNAFQTISQIVQCYTPFPIWDYWRVVEELPEMQAGHWGFLWRQHNEHRIVFPELVYIADTLLWHGRQYLPLAVTFLCYAGTWVVLAWSLVTDHRKEMLCFIFAGLLAGCMALYRSAAIVLAVPFLLQWTFMQLGVACALVFLSRMRNTGSLRLLAGVIVSAAVATYSSGNGLILWPLLLILALFIRIDRRRFLYLAIGGVITVGAYFIGFHSSGSLHLADLLTNPGRTLCFIASYLSMPFGGIGETPAFSLTAGFLVLAIIGICVAACIRKGALRDHASIVLFGFISCNVLTALITAGGRMNPDDLTYGGAKATRYLAVPQMNWAAAILLTLWVAGKLYRREVFAGAFVVISIALAVYLPKLKPWIIANIESFSEDQLVTLSFENNLPDPELSFKYVYPDLALIEIFRARLEASHLSIYYHPKSRWIGHPAADFAPARPGLPGAIVSAYPSKGSLQIIGWADDSQLRLPFTWVVLTDSSGTIRGFGRRFPAGFPSTASIPAFPLSLGWVGYVPSNLAGQKIFAHVVDPRKFGLMPLDADMVIPQISLTDLQHSAAPLPDIEWNLKLETPNDSRPDAPFPGERPPGDIHTTYGGSDAAIGTVQTSTFERPANGCLVVPVFNGPSVGHQSVRLEDAETNVAIAEVPLRDQRTQCHFWRFVVGPKHSTLRLTAEDEGRGWGQWIAVSTPLACR